MYKLKYTPARPLITGRSFNNSFSNILKYKLSVTKMNVRNISVIYPVFYFNDYLHRFKNIGIISLFIVGYLYVFAKFLSNYFITDFTVWLGLLLSTYIIKPNTAKTGKTKYFWMSIALLLLAFQSGLETFYFLALGFAILFSIEYIVGSIDY